VVPVARIKGTAAIAIKNFNQLIFFIRLDLRSMNIYKIIFEKLPVTL
jgi:hypothetical protein